MKKKLLPPDQKTEEQVAVEQKLRKSEQLFQTLMETIQGVVFVKDTTGKYLFVNNEFGKDFGIDSKAVIGKDDFFIFSPKLAIKLQENDKRILTSKRAESLEEVGVVNGRDMTYLTNKVPLLDDDGNTIGICGVGLNITRQKEMEQALKSAKLALEKRIKDLEKETNKRLCVEAILKHSDNKFKQILEDLGDKFVAYSHELDGTLTYASPGTKATFGILRKKMIGRDWARMIVWEPGDLELASVNIGNMIAGRAYRRMPMSFRHPDGTKRTVFISPHPVKNSTGEVVGVEGIVEDITERKNAEKALKKAHNELEKQVAERTAQLSESVQLLQNAERRYRTVADFTYDWEYWADLDGKLQYVSPSCERISGYTPQQFQENPSLFRERVFPEDTENWDEHYQDARKNPGVKEIQFRIRHRDGTVRWIEHICQPVRQRQGPLLGFRASNRDITTRKEKELQLTKAYSKIKELKAQIEADQTYLREEIKMEHNYENIIGKSDVMQYVFHRVQQSAPTDTTVLIQGETGTGKELIARAIHDGSLRRNRSLIKVDCASLPANLIESELFGHEKGAYTNATEKRVGRFELASGSTIFLDEIGELPMNLQSKLLRVLQDGEFERLGSSNTLHTDVRVIAATNRNLEKDVQKKKFRMDLWYRLNVFSITMPPLRERGEDICLIARHLTGIMAKKIGKQIKTIPVNVVNQLKNYSWPGNVRELENVIERSLINSQGDALQLDGTLHGQQQSDRKGASGVSIKFLKEVEYEHILLALRKTNWQIHGKGGAAALLDINPSTLRGRMRKLEIRRPPYKD